MAFSKHELRVLFDKIATFTDPKVINGTTRIAYSDSDEQAHNWLADEMIKRGLTLRTDHVGNIYARLVGQQSTLPAIGTGSHLDTVPQGGNYDGVIGVLTGLYALLQFKPKQLKRDLELIIFRSEESSRFGFSCLGSKAITGKIDFEKWKKNHDTKEQNCFEVISQRGYAPMDKLTNRYCQLPNHYLDAFVEVHIEQGKVLETEQKQIGVVCGIAAPTRFQITVYGQADHSGATPMNQRSDALVAAAHIITELNRIGCKESVYNTVATVGKLNVEPNSMNVIPGKVTLSVDIRGINLASINRVSSALVDIIKYTQTSQQCQIELREISVEQPVELDKTIAQLITSICEQKQLSSMSIVSGAGHDSMNMASQCPTAMIFIPSKQGISHHPNEYSDWQDILVAADVLTETLAFFGRSIDIVDYIGE